MTEALGMRADADRHELTLGRLTRGALHELANPLLALIGSAELALADADPGTKLHTRLGLVHRTALEIGEIVRALQGYARERDLAPERLSLADSARSATSLVQRVSSVRDVELSVRLEAEPVVVAPPGIVQRELVELLLGAVAAAGRGDAVELTVSATAGEAVASAGGQELRLQLAEVLS